MSVLGMCECEHCNDLRQMQEALMAKLSELGLDEQSNIDQAVACVQSLEALRNSLSYKHLTEAAAQNTSNTPTSRHNSASPTATRVQNHMVCDHCALHGLTCSSAPVCRNCRLKGQPCIRRWCEAPNGICSDRLCRRAHEVELPTKGIEEYSMEDFIILPGELPARNVQLANKQRPAGTFTPSVEDGKRKQQAVRDELVAATGGDHEKARNIYYPCGEWCTTISARPAPKKPQDQQKLHALSDRLLGKTGKN